MTSSQIIAQVLEERLQCHITTPRGNVLVLRGDQHAVEPGVEGADELASNPSLVLNAWAYARYTHLKVSLPSEVEQKIAENQADTHKQIARRIADLTDNLTEIVEIHWCSSCIAKAEHRKVKRPKGISPIWICTNCGSPTAPCTAPACRNMAVNGTGKINPRRYCAEHRHEVPSFSKATRRLETLGDYSEFLKYEKPDLSRVTKTVGLAVAGMAVAAPVSILAAPALGGALGALIGGYSGAAATSFGLAWLGGGAIAAGGLGMAGGTLVVTALGTAVGGALGASVTNAYVNEDKSFHIELLRGGSDVPVIVCNGFLSEGGKGWGDWKEIVTRRYPDSPVYRVHWGAKELKHLSVLGRNGVAKAGFGAVVQNVAKRAAKAATKRVSPLAPALIAADVAKNPWHVAKNRADKTGVILADLLGRTNEEAFVLVGHSLGARALTVAAQTLGTKPNAPKIKTMHLLGTAIGAKSDWTSLSTAVDEAVFNYHSKNDDVLKRIYTFAQFGQTAAGYRGFVPASGKLRNIDVTEEVDNHSSYIHKVCLL